MSSRILHLQLLLQILLHHTCGRQAPELCYLPHYSRPFLDLIGEDDGCFSEFLFGSTVCLKGHNSRQSNQNSIADECDVRILLVMFIPFLEVDLMLENTVLIFLVLS